MPSTVVLVHGAFADSSSWDAVISPLLEQGHRVIAAANPLRGLRADADATADLIRTLDGPIVLVGHSYGGAVISNVPADAGDITALVFVAGFAPDGGESVVTLSGKFPGSTLPDALRPVPRTDGTTDLYIARDRYHQQFCADVADSRAAQMAATQRPATQEALTEPSGGDALWRSRPSWFVFGDKDQNMPIALHRFMAERADARRAVEIAGASHAVGVSRPEAAVDVILEATGAAVAA